MLCRHLDFLQSPGILRHSRRRRSYLEDAEVAEFETVASGKLSNDFVEELLDYLLDQRLLRAGAFRDAVDQVLLGRCDQSPPGRAAVQLESREQSSQSTAETSKNKEFVLRRCCQATVSRLNRQVPDNEAVLGLVPFLPDPGAAVCQPRIPESRKRHSSRSSEIRPLVGQSGRAYNRCM